MYNVDKTDFCHVCVGKRLSNNPTGLSVAITSYGSTMMYINMKAMHSSTISVARMDIEKEIF